MILTGKEIEKRLGKDIHISPFDKKLLNPNSYNLHLYKELKVYKKDTLDMKKENPALDMEIPEEGLLLKPGKLYLGRTLEYTKTYNLVPMIEGRSSIGRLGMAVHITAGFGDVGFCGYWTLEIYVLSPIRIYPSVAVCQIFYHTIEGDISEYNSGKYQNNKGIQPSMLYKDFEK